MLGSYWQEHHRKAKGVYSFLSQGSKSHHPWMEGGEGGRGGGGRGMKGEKRGRSIGKTATERRWEVNKYEYDMYQ